jgi:hypothetical protein
MNQLALEQYSAWQQSLPVRSFPSDQLRRLLCIVDKRGCTWYDLLNEVLALAKADSAFLASAKETALKMINAQMTDTQLAVAATDALWPDDALTCVLVVEILKATNQKEADDLLERTTPEQMERIDKTCKEHGWDWENYCARRLKLFNDATFRRTWITTNKIWRRAS